MTRIGFCQNFSFNISRNISWAMLMSLALSQILNAAAPRRANTQPGREPLPATAQGKNQAAAERKFEEGEALRAQGTSESLQLAVKKYEEALLLWRAIGDRSGEARTLNNIGIVYASLGEKQEALDFYNQALPLRRAVGDRRGEIGTLNNIGLVYDSLGEKQKALDFYNQSLPLVRAVGDSGEEAITLNNIGVVYASLGE